MLHKDQFKDHLAIASLQLLCEYYAARLQRIREIIEQVEIRCAAVDGPITPTHEEITDKELRSIYLLTKVQRTKRSQVRISRQRKG